jgi:hypothetical protein
LTVVYSSCYHVKNKQIGKVREGAGGRGENDPNIVCTYEYNKKREKKQIKKKETCHNLLTDSNA